MSRKPFMKFYKADWQAKAALRACSPVARYLWLEMLLLMDDAEPRSHLLIGGEAPSTEELAQTVGMSIEDVADGLRQLERRGVFSRKKNGVIYSRKMERDDARSTKARANGRKGGNPRLKNEEPATETTYGSSDNQEHKQQDNHAPPRAAGESSENSERISGEFSDNHEAVNSDVATTCDHSVKPSDKLRRQKLEARSYASEEEAQLSAQPRDGDLSPMVLARSNDRPPDERGDPRTISEQVQEILDISVRSRHAAKWCMGEHAVMRWQGWGASTELILGVARMISARGVSDPPPSYLDGPIQEAINDAARGMPAPGNGGVNGHGSGSAADAGRASAGGGGFGGGNSGRKPYASGLCGAALRAKARRGQGV